MGILVNENQIGGGTSSNTSRNIGDIFYTTRTDNSLNGAVECNGSQYNFSDFDSNLQSLLDNGSIPSVTISEFDSIVSEKGWCDKIGYKNNIFLYPVWSFMMSPMIENRYNGYYYTNIYWGDAEVGEDGVLQGVKLYEKDTYNELVGWYVKRNNNYDYIYDENNEIVFSDYGWKSYNGEYAISVEETESTYFKVPKLSAYIIQKENIPVTGNGMTLSLTDGTNTVGIKYYGNNYCVAPFTSASAGGNVGDTASGVTSPLGNEKLIGVTTDPTKSGIISDLSNDSFTGRVMIQLFNSTTDTAVATCNQVLADVSALKNLSNISEAGKENSLSWIFPDYSNSVNIKSYTSQSNQYTCPSYGWVFVSVKGEYKTESILYINNIKFSIHSFNSQNYTSGNGLMMPVRKNATIYINDTDSGTVCLFFPLGI